MVGIPTDSSDYGNLLVYKNAISTDAVREAQWFCEYPLVTQGVQVSSPNPADVSLRTGQAGQCKYGRVIYNDGVDILNRDGSSWKQKEANHMWSTGQYGYSFWFHINVTSPSGSYTALSLQSVAGTITMVVATGTYGNG